MIDIFQYIPPLGCGNFIYLNGYSNIRVKLFSPS